MVTYAEIQAELDTKWNAAIIAKPTMKNGSLMENAITPNRVFIKVLGESYGARSAANKNYVGKQRFFIYIVAKDLADLEKFRSEIGRIIIPMVVSGGHMELVNVRDPEELKKRYNQTITFQQVKFKGYNQI